MTTPQDWERLSAYVDNRLAPAEKSKLEARLAREPELQVALDDLRSVVHALRSLPQLKPPRNFTLALSARAAHPARVTSVLRLATILAVLAFFVVVGGDIATTLVGTNLAAVLPEGRGLDGASYATAEAYPMAWGANEAAAETAAPSVLLLTQPTVTAYEMASVMTEVAATPGISRAVPGETPGGPSPVPAMSDPGATSGSLATLVPQAGGERMTAATDAEAGTGSGRWARPLLFSPLRYVEIGLALTAGALVLVSWWYRRR